MYMHALTVCCYSIYFLSLTLFFSFSFSTPLPLRHYFSPLSISTPPHSLPRSFHSSSLQHCHLSVCSFSVFSFSFTLPPFSPTPLLVSFFCLLLFFLSLSLLFVSFSVFSLFFQSPLSFICLILWPLSSFPVSICSFYIFFPSFFL